MYTHSQTQIHTYIHSHTQTYVKLYTQQLCSSIIMHPCRRPGEAACANPAPLRDMHTGATHVPFHTQPLIMYTRMWPRRFMSVPNTETHLRVLNRRDTHACTHQHILFPLALCAALYFQLGCLPRTMHTCALARCKWMWLSPRDEGQH